MMEQPDTELYFKIRNALALFAKINNRMEVSGLENIPDGGALICPCHRNYADPFFVGAAIPDRMLHFMAWHGIMEMPVVGPLAERLGCVHAIEESYGVSLNNARTKDVMSILREQLEAGGLCCIFPEGTIRHWITPKGPDKFKPGAVRLAAGAGVPIVPTGLTGTRWVVANIINLYDWGGPDKGIWFPTALPSKVRVRFGEPFIPDPAAAEDKDVWDSEAARLQKAVEAILDEMKEDTLGGKIRGMFKSNDLE